MSDKTLEYSKWGGTAIAHMFVRLIKRNNHPYNETPLTQEEFDTECKQMRNYIEWRKTNSPDDEFCPYRFTADKMSDFLDLIITSDNKNAVLDMWDNEMCGMNRFR
jgi:uncharacterized short protein YbdD (DUF466 family)